MLLTAAIVIALASPSPAPRPQPTNPFNLNPIPASTSLPIIGSTRSRAICTAIRRAVAPAVVAAMTNDKTYSGFRKNMYDYIVYGNESTKDMKLYQMDHTVQSMVKSVDDLETALNSHNFDIPQNASPRDAQALGDVRKSLRGVLEAQKVQLDAMSGFVETERMSRFGKSNESEQNMANATGQNNRPGTQQGPSAFPTDAPTRAFLRDSNDIFRRPQGQFTMHDAQNLDRDLGDIAAFTAKREDAASKAIIPATQLCK
ncbi:MAG TPA: hypothetical protein VGN14_13390 [Candidatus Elarobacter sp.]